MEKLKFGLLVIILALAFPVWFVVEMSQVDKVAKKYHFYKTETGITDKFSFSDVKEEDKGVTFILQTVPANMVR